MHKKCTKSFERHKSLKKGKKILLDLTQSCKRLSFKKTTTTAV